MIPPPGDHGGDGVRVARALGVDPAAVLDLSVSLNPVAPDVAELAAKHLDAVTRYPDVDDATAVLAAAIGVDRERVVLTNGGAEAIALVGAELGGCVDEPDFSLYPRHGGPVWRSNPCNPTGLLAAATTQAGVWDEAFYGLAAGAWTRGDPGAVVVGSLTKLFACPGLRIGYVIARDECLAASLRARQPAWSVNGLAAAVVPDLVERVDLAGWAAAVAGLRRDLITVLRTAGFDPSPSDANWVLVPDAAGLRERLARRGVVVRDCASFGLVDTVRVAVPDESGLARLEAALR